MKPLFLLQFACLIFMVVNALILAFTHLHVRWLNKRYERSRWLIFVAMLGLAIQYLMQMIYGFRATDDGLGAIINILVYTPCFTLIAMGIYNIEATHANRKKMNLICGGAYAAILATFLAGVHFCNGLHIGSWLYVMLALYAGDVVYCIYMIIKEMNKRKNMLETMAATDILPYVRYARASVMILMFTAVITLFAILNTKLLFIVGPLGLVSFFFFILSFVALGYNYTPTEELLDKEEEKMAALEIAISKGLADENDPETKLELEELNDEMTEALTDERQLFIQRCLDKWCKEMGYKDSTVNMLSLSHQLRIPKYELTQYFDKILQSTFRIWLSEIRFEAAKKMMEACPDFSNDIISAECGFSSRTHLYRIFKQKEDCTPTAWRERQQKESDSREDMLSTASSHQAKNA